MASCWMWGATLSSVEWRVSPSDDRVGGRPSDCPGVPCYMDVTTFSATVLSSKRACYYHLPHRSLFIPTCPRRPRPTDRPRCPHHLSPRHRLLPAAVSPFPRASITPSPPLLSPIFHTMARALVSPSPGDSDKPTNPSFVPPPVQRLSRSFSGFAVPSDRASTLPSRTTTSPLPGPNRAPAADSLYSQSSSSRPSNIFPRLHRLEIADDTTSNQKKTPLLDLRLSSASFLNAVATDTESEKPLYAVETVGSSTTVWRSDPWDCSAKIADIRWPKDLPLKGKGRDHSQGAKVQMDGPHWRETTTLLKPSGLGRCVIYYYVYSCTALDRCLLYQLTQVPSTVSSPCAQVEASREHIRGMCLLAGTTRGLTSLP